MRDLRAHSVDILTLGQYLRPSLQHLPLERYYHPDEFAEMKVEALALGFRHVESAPPVRRQSSTPSPSSSPSAVSMCWTASTSDGSISAACTPT